MINLKEKKFLRLDNDNVETANRLKKEVKDAAKDGRKFVSVNLDAGLPLDVYFEILDQFGYEHFQSYGHIALFNRVADGSMHTVGFHVTQDAGNMDE